MSTAASGSAAGLSRNCDLHLTARAEAPAFCRLCCTGRFAEPAAARRFDHEHITRLHLDRADVAELDDAAIGALNAVDAGSVSREFVMWVWTTLVPSNDGPAPDPPEMVS